MSAHAVGLHDLEHALVSRAVVDALLSFAREEGLSSAIDDGADAELVVHWYRGARDDHADLGGWLLFDGRQLDGRVMQKLPQAIAKNLEHNVLLAAVSDDETRLVVSVVAPSGSVECVGEKRIEPGSTELRLRSAIGAHGSGEEWRWARRRRKRR